MAEPPRICEIFPLSAERGDNVDRLIETTKGYLSTARILSRDAVTDQPERVVMAELIREKILRNYDKEIPYCCEIAIEAYREEPTIDRISAVIYVARDSQKGILIGHKGEKLKKVGQHGPSEDIEQFLGKKVFLQLYVKVNENWRDNEQQLKRFGYEQE